MKYTKCWIVVVAGLLALGPAASPKNPNEARAEQDRLQNAGKVMQEILDVPDNIPQDLLDSARCVVVMPSILKAAFVVGGSYGRGTIYRRRTKRAFGRCRHGRLYARRDSELFSRKRRICRRVTGGLDAPTRWGSESQPLWQFHERRKNHQRIECYGSSRGPDPDCGAAKGIPTSQALVRLVETGSGPDFP